MSSERPRYDHVFFDVADTLLGKPAVIDAFVDELAAIDIQVDPLTLRRAHKLLTETTPFPDTTTAAFYRDFNARVLWALGVEPTADLLERIHDRCRRAPWRPFDDTAALARIDLPLGIVSNWDHTLPEQLRRYFPAVSLEPVIGSAAAGVAKPDPGIFRLALEHKKLTPSRCLFVGDSVRLDMAPARAAGMDTVLIDRHGFFGAYRGRRVGHLGELIESLQKGA